DTYQHLMPTMQEQTSRAIEEAFGRTVAAGLEDAQLSRRETAGGRRRIRTSVGLAGDFTDRSLWPLGHPPVRGRIAMGLAHLHDRMAAMAKQDFSFDIVSEVSMPEVANAVDQARREIAQRFDFKDTGQSISQDDQLIEVRSSTEDRLKAAV